MEGPFFVIPSRRGSVPYLTPSQAKAILREEERWIGISAFDASEFEKPCAKGKMRLTDFCGLSGFRSIMTNRSSFDGLHSTAPSTDKAIAGDHEKGRVVLALQKWKDLVVALQPTAAVSMHEAVPLSEPLTKRRRMAATRTEAWAQKTRDMSDIGCEVVYPLSVGGESVFIDAAPHNENVLEFAANLASLGAESLKNSMCFAGSFVGLLAALGSSVRFIESPLPWLLAEKGIALTVFSTSATGGEVQINLNHDTFKLDIGPLSDVCDCYTCKRHNRAYLHHLLSVQEMNSTILLSIHNLAVVVRTVRAFREETPAGREALLMKLLTQF